ncbi:MAG TPA: phenylalanine--tRNA ligase subunit beta [Terriglobia bacterium]|nr:phenylalanine--tRNA ligase subunit beta [Terriglobia bacterium]
MRISLDWLREFVELPPDHRELEARLTMLGLGVASSVAVGNDRVLDLEVTTNRPDCLSHLGVARELAASFRSPLRPVALGVCEANKTAGEAVSIEIADPAGCARYCGRVIENVQVRPSPDWLARRLEAVGVRAINNIADITNYVLMELGHPLHAFDLERLHDRRIIVRRAAANEKLRTLDGVDRTLVAEDLVIADADRAVALAGVMGGEDSEISASTRSVMLESAGFEPVGVRRTAKRHSLHTEASHRFERGADIEMARLAIDRAAALMVDLAGGQVLEGVIDVYPARRERHPITLRPVEIRRILGADIPGNEVSRILTSLGFEVEPHSDGSWSVTAPSYRVDVSREVDLIEEIARLHGYDRLPAHVRPAPPSPEHDLRRQKELALSAALTGLCYREIILPTMVDPEENARFTGEQPVRLLNPLTQDASAMRSTPVPGMLRALRWNLDRGQDDLRFFEFGKVYTTSTRTDEGLPAERRVLTMGISGSMATAGVHDSEHSKRRPVDVFDLKGDLEVTLGLFDLVILDFAKSGCSYHEADLGGRFAAEQGNLAHFGQVSHEVTREYKLRQPVYIAEVDLERLMAYPLRHLSFRPFSKFPAVQRDLSLVVPLPIRYRQIEEALSGLQIEELQQFGAVDRFEGGALPPGHYGLLLRIHLQSSERTLTSEEADAMSHRVLDALRPLGIQLRSA